ncbi:MAG: M20/M25/M40 family metallo-hydrolase, partial [bacterium]|nr:M20/M25/M40 family metallo-hydrolase [bacterium]
MNNISDEIFKQQEKLLKLLILIASIPSPTGREQKKIQFINQKVNEYGVKNTSIDNAGNLIVKFPSKSKDGSKKTILVVAHTDTACDPGEKVFIRQDSKYIYGHGVCDNSTGVTALLTTIELIKNNNLEFDNNLIIGFTVGEEGLGAKRGMKQIIKDYGKQIDAVINVESHNIGRVTNQVIGQYRFKLSINTKIGGHSFRDFGRPNTNVILSQIISDFSCFKLFQTKDRTTFNIAQIKGEGSINAISQTATCLFEIRSEDNKNLEKAKKTLGVIISKYKKQFPDILVEINVSAQVPAVIFPAKHRIYQLTMDVQKKLGILPKINAGNTDGDVSMAVGIPTVTIGTSNGWNTHSMDE